VLARGGIGGTTVSATLHLARLAEIEFFATGGIGGVHRGAETCAWWSSGQCCGALG
jgi:pseudouridine-5'-phosphate glycosidase